MSRPKSGAVWSEDLFSGPVSAALITRFLIKVIKVPGTQAAEMQEGYE